MAYTITLSEETKVGSPRSYLPHAETTLVLTLSQERISKVLDISRLVIH